MISRLFVAALLALGHFALAAPADGPLFNCGSNPSPERVAAVQAAHFSEHKKAGPSTAGSGGIIRVLFHVIAKDNTAPGGNVPDNVLAQQMVVLNRFFAPTGYSFIPAGVTRTINPDWFNNVAPGNAQEAAMKKALRAGGPADLNVYTLGKISGGDFLGYAAFPWDFRARPYLDGVMIDFGVLPGGSYPQLNTGGVLVHEVGHWVGLLHTFQGGCTAPGDYVDDTPSERTAARGCPTGRDTCPGGLADPIHNHMDYTIDSCRTEFTQGQIVRLRQALGQFRGI